MIVFDIGNSTITFSAWVGTKWKKIVRIPSSVPIDEEQCIATLKSYLASVDTRYRSTAVLCSVVPQLTPVLHALVRDTLQCDTLLLRADSKSPLSKPMPKNMGQDLLANAVSGHIKSNGVIPDASSVAHSAPSCASVTVDLGTALTFTAVDASGKIAGVAIAPGIKTSYQSLVTNTAQIPHSLLKMPTVALGHTTATALNSGVLLGYKHLIKGMVLQIKEELHSPCKVYATGGLGSIIKTLAPPYDTIFDEIDAYHTLRGIRILGEYNM